ncbi:hypothetical protein LMG33818_001312 [Halomonadaceae bacterium LMG 33818]|uniref:hypothetical protein n=1 Tax=Cernens ardua TaxID=3402176 RepID=UPI003EDB9643
MLLSNSLPLLWLYYAILSLIVLVAGYFAIGFLPRLLRWTITGLVAGIIWTPWIFNIAATHDSPAYTGLAPAVINVAMDVLAHRGGTSFIVLLVGAVIGAVLGATLAVRTRKSKPSRKDHNAQASKGKTGAAQGNKQRPQEPTL